MTLRVAVVGAGIAGLSAAYELARRGADPVVFDADDRAGGKLRTSDLAGVAVDESADAFLGRVPWARELCEELGLGDELVAPTTGAALVHHHGRLHRLPAGLVLGVPTDLRALDGSGLLTPAGMAAVAADLDRPHGAPCDLAVGADVAVGPLVRSRVGDEVFEVLVDPLLSGVNAGRADELSAEMGAAQLLSAARADTSLVRALRAVRPAADADGSPTPVFLTLPGGLGARLPGALVDAVGPRRLRLRSIVNRLEAVAGGYRIGVDGAGTAPIAVDAVVLATPAPVSAALLRSDHPEEAAVVAGLSYASVTLVGLAFGPESAMTLRRLDASGFLVPRRSGLLLTACSWASSKFTHLGGDGVVRLRASVGRSDDTRPDGLDDEALLHRVRADLATTMDLDPAWPALATRVSRWPSALPQYRPGHAARAAAVDDALPPRLRLAGAAQHGLGVPACVASGRRAARALLGADR